MAHRSTRFSDVCGSVDELKRLLHEEYKQVTDEPSHTLVPLIDDAVFMLGQMRARLDAYGSFRGKLRDLLSLMDQIKEADVPSAEAAIAFVRERCLSGEKLRRTGVEEMNAAAEALRDTANARERQLRAYKDLALKMCALLGEIRGNRLWFASDSGAESALETLKAKYQAWLPPEPHGSVLLGALTQSLAAATDGGPGNEPIVHFEDGGSIPMSNVRWKPEIQSFHNAATQPSASAFRYRPSGPAGKS